MIASFRDRRTEELYAGRRIKGIHPDLARAAERKLKLLDAATSLADLKVPPGNRLEALKGDREGQHSVRINDQFRICFTWREDKAQDVEFVDYH